MARQRVVEERSAQRARRDRDRESEWNCAQLHFWRREGEAEVQARPAQAHVHPTTAQWAQTTVHKAQAAQQQQHHGRPRDGRQLSIHAMQTMCLCYHRPTNHVVRFRSSGCGGTGVSNSAIASNFSETLRHCTALHCCWLLAAALLSLLRSRCWLYTGRPEADAGRSVAFFCDSLPPLTPLLHFPLFAPSQHTSACIRQSSKRHRASCSARSACRRRRRCQAGPGSCCSRESANN